MNEKQIKFLIITITFLVLIGLGTWMVIFFRDNDNALVVKGEELSRNNQNKEESVLSAEQNGVTVEIEEIKKDAQNTIILLKMNNHRFNLEEMNPITGSSLKGVQAKEYKILETAMGGHHVEAKMVFAGNLSGEFILKLQDDLVFKFKI